MTTMADCKQIYEALRRGDHPDIPASCIDGLLLWLCHSQHGVAEQAFKILGKPDDLNLVMRVYRALDGCLFFDSELLPLQGTPEEHRKRYRLMMRAFHPDRYPEMADWLGQRSQSINAAYTAFKTRPITKTRVIYARQAHPPAYSNKSPARPVRPVLVNSFSISDWFVSLCAPLTRMRYLPQKILALTTVLCVLLIIYLYHQRLSVEMAETVNSMTMQEEVPVAFDNRITYRTQEQNPTLKEEMQENAKVLHLADTTDLSTGKNNAWQTPADLHIEEWLEGGRAGYIAKYVQNQRFSTRETEITDSPELSLISETGVALQATEPQQSPTPEPEIAADPAPARVSEAGLKAPPVKTQHSQVAETEPDVHSDKPTNHNIASRESRRLDDLSARMEAARDESPGAAVSATDKPVTARSELPAGDSKSLQSRQEVTEYQSLTTVTPEPALSIEPVREKTDEYSSAIEPALASVEHFRDSFERGELKPMLEVIADDARENENTGMPWFHRIYSKLFKLTRQRELNLDFNEMYVEDGIVKLNGEYRMQLVYNSGRRASGRGPMQYRLKPDSGDWKIIEIRYQKTN